MKKPLLAWMLSFAMSLAGMAGEDGPKNEFIQNGKVKIGVDLSSGGAVFWFSELPSDRNLLNHADRGRFIQQSYYGKPDGSTWADKPWRWNPVQGGDYKGKPSKTLEGKHTPESLYVRSVPVNWAGGQDVEDCRMEEWIDLNDKVAHLRFRFSYQGNESHPPNSQEMPAVFMDHDLTELVYYKGANPWKGEAFQKDTPGWPNEQRSTDENWAGFIGKDGRGLGVFFPGTNLITTYRYDGPGGPAGGGCSYFAPVRTFAITPGFVIEYHVYLTIGTPEQMRDRFKPLVVQAAK